MKDVDIRRELHRSYLSHFYKNDANSKVIDELGICQGASLVDIAVVNGSMWGWEIKSEKDNLKRLPLQMSYYNKVFDYITIVTNENHLNEIKEIVPKYWGVICVKKKKEGFELENLRKPKKNKNVDAFSLVQFLWKEEALEVLEKEGLIKGMKSKPRKLIWRKIAESLELEKINYYVRTYLKNRKNWRVTDLQLLLNDDLSQSFSKL